LRADRTAVGAVEKQTSGVDVSPADDGTNAARPGQPNHSEEPIVAFAGANKVIYETMQNTVVPIGGAAMPLTPTGARLYLGDTIPYDGIPAWQQPDPTGRVCASIYPELWKLVNGYYDSQLQDFLTAVPAGPTSLVALYHEASTMGTSPSGPYYSYFQSLDSNFPNSGGAAGLLRAAQVYVQTAAIGTNVKVGAIEMVDTDDASQLGGRVDSWMAEGLDFYACDIYDSSTADADPGGLLGAWQSACESLSGPGATIGVTETNSRFPGRRPWWFTTAWSWLQSNGYTSNRTSFLTFWNPTGEESGPWIADDWATIDALYAICSQSSP
jgi:hypothetical protein